MGALLGGGLGVGDWELEVSSDSDWLEDERDICFVSFCLSRSKLPGLCLVSTIGLGFITPLPEGRGGALPLRLPRGDCTIGLPLSDSDSLLDMLYSGRLWGGVRERSRLKG